MSLCRARCEVRFPVIEISRICALLDRVDQPQKLFRLAAMAQRQDNIVGLHPPQVAVDRLGRMKKMARRTRRGQRRADLAADDPRLAHPGHDHRAGILEDHPRRRQKRRIDPVQKRQTRPPPHFESPPAQIPDQTPRLAHPIRTRSFLVISENRPFHRGRWTLAQSGRNLNATPKTNLPVFDF